MTRVGHGYRVGLVLAAAAMACTGNKVGDGDGGAPSDGGVAAGQLLLVRVGQGALLVHPNEPFTITAQLSLTEHGPVPNAQVVFKMTEQPGQITLSSPADGGMCDQSGGMMSCTTDSNGLVQLEINPVDTGEFALQANSAGAMSTAVWKLDVETVVETLQIVPNTMITALDPPNDTMGAASVPFGSIIPLEVLVTEEGAGGAPIPLPNQTVTFQLFQEAGQASFSGNSMISVTTRPDGTAIAQFTVGTNTGLDAINVALSNAQTSVSFNITVTAGCMSSQDCNGNQCDLTTHQCVTGSSSGNMCGVGDVGCPIGYTCNASTGACAPASLTGCPTCPAGETCDPSTNMCVNMPPQCTTNADCPNGMCMNGVCYPNSGSVIDVTGHWYTEHIFDVEAALPGWLSFSSTAIRTIDQVILGQLNLPSWVNAIISSIVQQYVPQWVQTLVYLLDNVLTLFNNLEADGEMNLTAINGNLAIISGVESWTTFDFYLLAQCGTNIAGNPSEPPPCALFNVYTSSLPIDLSVDVKPFSATVVGTSTSGTIEVSPRDVDMAFAGLLLYVLNQAVDVVTGYPSLTGPPGDPQDGALYNLVDCPDLASQIMSIIPIDVTGLCEAAVEGVADVIAQQLQSVTITDDVLSFSGHATAWADPTDPAYMGTTYATDLGYSDYSTRMPSDGLWNGNFTIIGDISNVPGSWHASREVITPQ